MVIVIVINHTFFCSCNLIVIDNNFVWVIAIVVYYPRIAELAKRLFAVPATSAPIERVFSETGKILNPLQCRIHPKNLETPENECQLFVRFSWIVVVVHCNHNCNYVKNNWNCTGLLAIVTVMVMLIGFWEEMIIVIIIDYLQAVIATTLIWNGKLYLELFLSIKPRHKFEWKMTPKIVWVAVTAQKVETDWLMTDTQTNKHVT